MRPRTRNPWYSPLAELGLVPRVAAPRDNPVADHALLRRRRGVARIEITCLGAELHRARTPTCRSAAADRWSSRCRRRYLPS
jgi:hypothetical protein